MKWISTTFLLALVIFMAPSVFAISDSCEYTGPPAPAKGPVAEEVRVLAMNVWGQKKDSEARCQKRLKTIGENIADSTPPFNIIGLTEVHPDYPYITCDGKVLVNALQKNGEYRGNKARWGHPETKAFFNPDSAASLRLCILGGLLLDSCMLGAAAGTIAGPDGGTSLFATSEFSWSPYKDHVQSYEPKHNLRTAHGFVHSRISVTTDLMIDVYVTHLYSGGELETGRCDQQCRYEGLQMLAEAIHKHSAESGFPVLVMGDFNIGGPNPSPDNDHCLGNLGYGDIMEVLRNPRDLWLEAHPNKKGSTSHFDNAEKSGQLMGGEEERIDYIFVMTDPYFTNSPYELVIKDPEEDEVDPEKINYGVQLVEWTMPEYDGENGEFPVSDHKGIEVTLEIRKRLDWATILAIIN